MKSFYCFLPRMLSRKILVSLTQRATACDKPVTLENVFFLL